VAATKGALKMKNNILIAALVFSLSGCVSVGNKVDTTKAAAFVKGQTTSAEVIAALGVPQSVGSQSDGKKILSYFYSSATPNAASFIPFVGLFAGKTTGETSIVVFTFTPDDKMESYTATQATTSAGFGGAAK
jgi:hypothetical protein